MHPFSSLLSYYIALLDSDLPEVKKWSACLGVNTHFSNGIINLFIIYSDANLNIFVLFAFLIVAAITMLV